MLSYIFFKISKYVIKKYFQIVLLMSKLFLNCFYVDFKQWLYEVKNPYMYFSFIRLIPNFYDVCIMYLLYIYDFTFFMIQNSKNLVVTIVFGICFYDCTLRCL
jgi:hypothetical protein